MRFFSLVATALATAVSVLAQSANPINAPTAGAVINAGTTSIISWTVTAGNTVTLKLRSGPSNNLIPGVVIVAGAPNSGSYAWAVPASITRGSDYTIEIIDDQNPSLVNYSPFFVIQSSNTVASSTNASPGGTKTTMKTSTKTAASSSASFPNVPTSTGTSVPATSVSPIQTGSSSSGNGAQAVHKVEGAMAAIVAVGMGVAYAL